MFDIFHLSTLSVILNINFIQSSSFIAKMMNAFLWYNWGWAFFGFIKWFSSFSFFGSYLLSLEPSLNCIINNSTIYCLIVSYSNLNIRFKFIKKSSFIHSNRHIEHIDQKVTRSNQKITLIPTLASQHMHSKPFCKVNRCLPFGCKLCTRAINISGHSWLIKSPSVTSSDKNNLT